MKKSLATIAAFAILTGCNDNSSEYIETPPPPPEDKPISSQQMVDEVLNSFNNMGIELSNEEQQEYSALINRLCDSSQCVLTPDGIPAVAVKPTDPFADNTTRQLESNSTDSIKYLPTQHKMLVVSETTLQGDLVAVQVPTTNSDSIIKPNIFENVTDWYDFNLSYVNNVQIQGKTVSAEVTPHGEIIGASSNIQGAKVFGSILFTDISSVHDLGASYEITPELREIMSKQVILFHQGKLTDNQPVKIKWISDGIPTWEHHTAYGYHGATNVVNLTNGGISGEIKSDGKRAFVFRKDGVDLPLNNLELKFDINTSTSGSYVNLYLVTEDGKNKYRADIYENGSITLKKHNGKPIGGKYDITVGNFVSFDDLVVDFGELKFNQNHFDATFMTDLNIQWSSHNSNTDAISGEVFTINGLDVIDHQAVEPVIKHNNIYNALNLKTHRTGTVSGEAKGSNDANRAAAVYFVQPVTGKTLLKQHNLNFNVSFDTAFVNIYLQNGMDKETIVLFQDGSSSTRYSNQNFSNVEELVAVFGDWTVRKWSEWNGKPLQSEMFTGNFILRSADVDSDDDVIVGEEFRVTTYDFSVKN